jgi:sulfur carrier protein
MRVVVNGFTEELKPGTRLQQLIEQQHDQSPSLIAEVNGRFIYPRNYLTLEINDGDRVELIHPAFGG